MARLGRSRPRRIRSGGRSFGRGTSSRTKGLTALERRIAAMSGVGSVDAGLKSEASSGMTYDRKGERPEARSASDNAKIWNRHRKEGRNPFKYDERKGVKIWKDGANKVIKKDTRGLKTGGKKLAEYMRKEVVRNISTETGMKSLSPRYAAWKRKKFGGRSILVRTGQLLGALKPVVIEFKG